MSSPSRFLISSLYDILDDSEGSNIYIVKIKPPSSNFIFSSSIYLGGIDKLVFLIKSIPSS